MCLLDASNRDEWMIVRLAKNSRQALYKQIVEQLRQQILSGEMPPGYRLPPERQLAETLGVNRTTILTAYRELKAEGLIESHVGRGTVVSCARPLDQSKTQSESEPIWEHLLSDSSQSLDNGAIEHILQLINQQDIISFAGGISSLDPRPVEAIAGLEEELLRDARKRALLVSPVEGFYSLRERMADFMNARGCFCQPEEIMMVSGAQQGIDLVARTLLNPGDTVLMEEPSFFPAIHAFKAAGARLMGVPLTAEGMDMDILERLLQRYKPKFIYTMPTYQNPAGVSLSMPGRIRLLELAGRYQAVIVEDDPYSELRYEGETLPSLKSMDSRGFVIYLGTFSKTVSPGLRLGWVCCQRKMLRALTAVKQHADVHSSSISQYIMERFMTGGKLESYISAVCQSNRQRRDVMIEAFERCAVSDGLRWNRPAGGSYLWCALPGEITATGLFHAATRNGVAVLPGPLFTLSPHKGEGFIRLNFTYENGDAIRKGVRLLCEQISRLREDHPGRRTPQAVRDMNPFD